MAKAVIHVNRAFIAANAKDGRNRPCYTIKCRGKTRYARSFTAKDVTGVPYGEQLACGARIWLECDDADLVLHDEMSFEEAKKG